MQGFSLGAQVFLYRTTAKSSWKKADKFPTSLWTRLVPLISKWSLKVLHTEISNRFNVAPHLTFLDFQSYIIYYLNYVNYLWGYSLTKLKSDTLSVIRLISVLLSLM